MKKYYVLHKELGDDYYVSYQNGPKYRIEKDVSNLVGIFNNEFEAQKAAIAEMQKKIERLKERIQVIRV